MKHVSFRLAALAGAVAGFSAVSAAAGQLIVLPPYVALNNVIYDVDYAVSIPPGNGLSADTLVSIGLPSKVGVSGCQVQVAWFDWNGAAAGLSGPGTNAAGAPITLFPGETLEFTTSSNGVPGNYPDFQENVFRDMGQPFEGYAQVRISCSPTAIAVLRVDAEFATSTPGVAGAPAVVKTKTINVTKPTGLMGY